MHDLDMSTDGSAVAFYSHREIPWHKLGTVTEDAKTAEEALQIAHLDYEVTKVPVTAQVITDDGVSTVEVPGKFATIRPNPFTGELEALGVVGSQYEVVQNRANTGFLDALVGLSGSYFETMGALNGGRTVFASMKAPKGLLIGGHDAVDLYLVARNSHDGTSPFSVIATPIRPVCRNTLTAGASVARATWTRRHTRNVLNDIEAAQQSLGVAWNVWDEFEHKANGMFDTEVTKAEFDAIIGKVFPEPAGATDRSKRQHAEKLDAIRTVYASPTQDGIRGTAWGAYNAITEYVDWVLPVRGSDTARAERIANGGWVEATKQAAFNLLTA